MRDTNFDDNVRIQHNLKSLPKQKELRFMPFGRFIDENKKIKSFINDPATQTTHLSIKHQSVARTFKEFKDLNNVDRFYARFNNGSQVKDDSFEVHYTVKA